MRSLISSKALAFVFTLAVGLPLMGAEALARRSGRPRLSRKQKRARKQAKKLVVQGVAKLREGDYVAALELFTRAFRIYPSPKIQFNIGQTYKELGRYLDAIGAYETFLKDAPSDISAALRKLARDNIRDLFRKICVLRVEVSVDGARISVDGRPRGLSPLKRPLRLMPGAHSMVVKRDGYVTEVVDLKLPEGKRLVRRVVLRKPRPKVVRVVYKTVRIPKKGLPLLWTGIALTGAVALVAAVTGSLALVEQDRFENPNLSLAERRAAGERGERYQWATDGLLIGAGVFAVATLVWYLAYVRPSGGTRRVREKPRAGGITLTPVFRPAGGGLTLRF